MALSLLGERRVTSKHERKQYSCDHPNLSKALAQRQPPSDRNDAKLAKRVYSRNSRYEGLACAGAS